MSGRGVGAGSGRSGKSFEQLEREVAELRRLVKELMQPKSRARVVNVGAAGSDVKIVKATSGICARSGTTLGSATCTEFKIVSGDLTTNTETLTVLNLSLLAIPVDTYVLAQKEIISGEWIAQAIINGLRYSSPNLQYKVGDDYTDDWVTWHTANTTCPYR